MRSCLVILGWNSALVLVGLIVAELVFGGWLDSINSPSLWRLSIYRNVEWKLSAQDKYARPDPVIYRRDKYGFRGHYGSPGDISVLVMGGSTTDERFVSEGETWTEVMNACLGKDGQSRSIANAGVAGQSSRGHLRNFDAWLAHIDGLHPKTILYYVGVNERALEGRIKEDDVTAYNESGRPLWLERIRLNSAVLSLFSTITGNMRAASSGLHHLSADTQNSDSINAKFRETAKNVLDVDGQDYKSRLETTRQRRLEDLRAYDDRLMRLLKASRAFGAEPIFVTQSEAAWRRVGNTVQGDLDTHFEMAAVNDATLAFCRRENLTCVDLANQLPFGDGDFYDSVHTTPQGSAKIGQHLCQALRNRL